MKRRLSLLLVLCLLCALLGGCAAVPEQEPASAQEESLPILASFVPLYALAEPLFAGVPGVRLSCLVQPQDGCLRSYSPSQWDDMALGSAHAMLLFGCGMESYEFLAGASHMPLVYALDSVTLIGSTLASSDEENHFTGENPWAFLDPDCAAKMLENLCAGMCVIDSEHAFDYTANLQAALAQLDAAKAEADALLPEVPPTCIALGHEGLAYLSRRANAQIACTLQREPGTDLSDNEFADALELLTSCKATTLWLEKQAPQGLVRAFEKAGIRVCLFDTCTDLPLQDAFSAYLSALTANAQAIAE